MFDFYSEDFIMFLNSYARMLIKLDLVWIDGKNVYQFGTKFVPYKFYWGYGEKATHQQVALLAAHYISFDIVNNADFLLPTHWLTYNQTRHIHPKKGNNESQRDYDLNKVMIVLKSERFLKLLRILIKQIQENENLVFRRKPEEKKRTYVNRYIR
jgi:hypothetical protein